MENTLHREEADRDARFSNSPTISVTLERMNSARVLLAAYALGWLLIRLASGATPVDWLKVSLNVEDNAVATVDPQSGEEIIATERSATLSLSGVRDSYAYIVEESDNLLDWTERYRFNGEPNQVSLVQQLVPFERGFIRLRLAEKPAIPTGFALIPAGTFLMGSPTQEPGRGNDETLHEVTLTRGFHMSETEVTWSEWNDVRDWAINNGYEDLAVGRNGRNGNESGRHPVTEISWFNAIKWCNARSEMEGRIPAYYLSDTFETRNVFRMGSSEPFVNWNADGYRLPTEAEWEGACRAGAATAFQSGAITHTDLSPIDPNLDAVGWYGGNSESNTHETGSKAPNFFGLYDMHGNVREWCWDWYGPYEASSTDPKGEDNGTIRVFRGGSWAETAQKCRSASRDGFSPHPATDNYGLRVVINSDS